MIKKVILLLSIFVASCDAGISFAFDSHKERTDKTEEIVSYVPRPHGNKTMLGDVGEKTLKDTASRIVGGITVPPNRFPYFVYYEISTNGGTFICGGTLIWVDSK